MGILSSLFIVFVVLLIIGGIMMFFRQDRQNFGWPEDEVVTHTTTTTYHEPQYEIVGTLDRQFENGQSFVIDPVDRDKVWLNSKDDLYEDGAGKIWSLR
jgi:hypothetical protein